MKLMRNAFILIAMAGAAGLAVIHNAPVQAQAKVCQIQIAGNDLMQFDKKGLEVAGDCAEVELTLAHTGKLPRQAMGHNWVLARTADANAVAADGIKAGLQNEHVPQNDKRVIVATKVIGGGEKASVRFKTAALKKGESYTYICTFPGHSAMMRGTLTFG